MTAPPVPTPEDIKAQYGFVAMLAQAVPEIGALMQQAVTQKWTAERFQMAVASTTWWKQTPQQTRQWVTQNVADPASAARSLKTGGEQVNIMAGQYGYSGFSAARSQEIWLQGQLAGYDETQMKIWAFNESFRAFGATNSGEFGARRDSARELASSYGYTAGDNEINDWMVSGIRSAQSGDNAMAGWTNKLKSYAKSKFAPFADRIDQGETVMDIARPYMDVYAQTLEVNPADVGLDDKYIQRWLQGKSEAGKPPAATAVWQAQQELRKDNRWGYTVNARQSAAETATVIGKAFGMIG